ncbi:MAG: serine/threonine-protein kinase [Polyangiaceae bacterium]
MQHGTPSLAERIGRYRVVRLLGRGAMGQVVLARDPLLDREVALKHLRSDVDLSPEQIEGLTRRMRHEAKAAARLSHPHLVALHDIGEAEPVGLYLVFEYVEGPSLKRRLARGRLTAREAAAVARQLGSALSHAHAAGVVHRDVKPDNVILSPRGARLGDFGIARLPDSTLTVPGGLIGTPAYSAPETIDDNRFSAQSDQFSLAATLFEALSGRRAFPGDDALDVAALVQTSDPPPFARALALDASVDDVLARGLSKQPGERFASCAELGDALAEALELRYRPHMSTLPDERHLALAVHAEPRRPRHGWLLAALLLALGMSLGVLVAGPVGAWLAPAGTGAATSPGESPADAGLPARSAP